MKHRLNYTRHRKPIHGFTLIELLVVIAIIALLLSIIIPALRTAKRIANGTVCTSSNRQLMLAWCAYAGDNNDHLVGAGTALPTDFHFMYDWVGTPINENGSYRIDTLDDRLRGIRIGRLFPYTKDTKVYHCPTDRRLQDSRGQFAAYRSYSIQGFMNGYWGEGARPYVNVSKHSQIELPSSKIVCVEEADPRGFNWGNWNLPLHEPDVWGDWLAIWHGERSTFGYADGHAELHKWKDDTTMLMTQALAPYRIETVNSVDRQYMQRAIKPR